MLKATSLFDAAKDELFEDGIETEFSRAVAAFIAQHGTKAVDALTKLILSGKADSSISAEALLWIARIEHPRSYLERLWLLERSLVNPVPQVRDAAALGLGSLDDPRAIKYVQQAIDLEKCVELREGLEHLLAQLRATKQCHSS
jgi:hypothetical protein